MRTRTTRAIGAAALAITLALATTACGGGGNDEPAAHGKADVTFASDMLVHHSQALTMVDLTEGRPLDPEVERLATQIRAAQTPEIKTFTSWLTDWDEKVPDTGGDAGGHDMDGMDSEMPGMMSADEMSGLENADDAAFQRQWLTLMIKHHEGALTMAKTEIDDGRYQPAVDLAKRIVSSQSKEIATMKRLLTS